MTELIITPKTQGFLSEIIKISFPSGHEWTASAQVSAIININIGKDSGAILNIAGFSLDTDTGNIYSVAQYPNPFTIPLNFQTGPNIGINAWGQTGGFWFIESATMSLSKVVLSANPNVSVSGTFTATPVGTNAGITVNAAATAATSGRPGGDATASQTAPQIVDTPNVVTITGSASASLHDVTASVSAH